MATDLPGILIVDGNEDNRYTLQLMRECNGHERITCAAGGNEAIALTIAFVETPASEPKSEQDHRGNNAAAKRVPRGAMAADRFFALAERWLRPADKLDYMIRRWLIPVSFEPNRSIATDSSLRWSHKHSRGVSEFSTATSLRT